MKKEFLERAKDTTIIHADALYKTMSVPENQGKNFSWNIFPDMAGRISSANIFTSFSNDEWFSFTQDEIDKLIQMGYEAGLERAKEVLKDNELL